MHSLSVLLLTSVLFLTGVLGCGGKQQPDPERRAQLTFDGSEIPSEISSEKFAAQAGESHDPVIEHFLKKIQLEANGLFRLHVRQAPGADHPKEMRVHVYRGDVTLNVLEPSALGQNNYLLKKGQCYLQDPIQHRRPISITPRKCINLPVIGPLLMLAAPNWEQRYLFHRTGEEELAGVSVYTLQAEGEFDSVYLDEATFWIAKDDFRILKQEFRADGGREVYTLQYSYPSSMKKSSRKAEISVVITDKAGRILGDIEASQIEGESGERYARPIDWHGIISR